MKIIDISNCSDEVTIYINNLQKLIAEKDKEIERLNNIINEITKFIKHDYFKAREFKEKIQRSELCQGDYPIAYYHADWLEDTTDEYLNKLQELKGSDRK